MRMFNRFLIILWLFSFGILVGDLPVLAESPSQPVSGNYRDRPIFVPGEIIIKVAPNMSVEEVSSLSDDNGPKILERNVSLGI